MRREDAKKVREEQLRREEAKKAHEEQLRREAQGRDLLDDSMASLSTTEEWAEMRAEFDSWKKDVHMAFRNMRSEMKEVKRAITTVHERQTETEERTKALEDDLETVKRPGSKEPT